MIVLSVAFDTIDHHILLHRIRHRYGVSGAALKWIESYLTDRCQRVRLNDEYSPRFVLSTGVPQGSVLGPLLFSLHTTNWRHYKETWLDIMQMTYNYMLILSAMTNLYLCVWKGDHYLQNTYNHVAIKFHMIDEEKILSII